MKRSKFMNKQMASILCATLSVSMAAGTPMAALAEEPAANTGIVSEADETAEMFAEEGEAADKTALKTVIDEADRIINDEADQYTAASIVIFKAAVNNSKIELYKENSRQKDVDAAEKNVVDAKTKLVKRSTEELDINNLADGKYEVAVNLWNAGSDSESMGNAALDHSAILNVKDGKYTLTLMGTGMKVGNLVGELESLRIVADGANPAEDDSNYTEIGVREEDGKYYIDIELKNPTALTEYYYAGIKVHAVNPNGDIMYPMGKNWVDNRLRVSWESLTVKELAVNPAGADLTAKAQELKEKYKDGSAYTEASYKKLTDAIAEAEKIAVKGGATDEEIQAATEALEKAEAGLQKLADKTALKAAIDEAEHIVNDEASPYTAASINIYKSVLNNAKTEFYKENSRQKDVDAAEKTLVEAKAKLVKRSAEELDINNLADGQYEVAVNLWNADNDSESMGNMAFDHTAVLNVKNGKYTLTLTGEGMTVGTMVGKLDSLRIVADGAKPEKDESNYTEIKAREENGKYYIDVELKNPTAVTEYYYAGIKVFAVLPNGDVTYPMGQNWINNRLRISWESITLEKLADPVESFVERLYTEVLGRDADPNGLAAWTQNLKDGKETGAKVAMGFVDSDEFKNKDMSDEEFLEIMYRTFLGRPSDEGGLKEWKKVLDEGMSRMFVFRGFVESDEFTAICDDYDIIRGNVVLNAPMDQRENEDKTKFVARCYNVFLGRKADADGLNSWVTQLVNGSNNAKEAAKGFVMSDEFQGRNLSNEEYVKTIYVGLLDREADPKGLAEWVKVLENGGSRLEIFYGFADSKEFRELADSYGLASDWESTTVK